MSGRVDATTHQVALAKANEAAPYSEEFLQQLEIILASPAFKGSRRSQEFLRHVVEIALQGEGERLKERIIGIDIFHRDPDYDTGDDAIVRVTASDVRRRLMQYYAEENSCMFRLDLPAGSYIPEFRRIVSPISVETVHVDAQTSSDVSSEPPTEQETTPPQNFEIPDSDVTVVVSAAPIREKPTRTHFSPVYVLLAVGLAALFFAMGWITKSVSSQSAGISSTIPSRYSFYRELLGPIVTDPQMETEIVLSNPRLLLYRGSTIAKPDEDIGSLQVLLSAPLAKQLAGAANDTQALFPYHRLVLDSDNYTGLGEAKTAFHLGALLELLGRKAHLGEARFLNWEVARSEHFIVLGAPHMSEWTQNSLASANFTMDHDVIRNNHPYPGEPQVYARSGQGSGLEDYGLIWMSSLPSGSRVLILAGITSAGTAGVGSFFADPDSMRAVYEQLKQASSSFPSDWQALVRISARDNVPVKVSLVSVRISAKKQ